VYREERPVDALLGICLSNAVAATVLALLAAVAGLVCRRPAVAHALWLLVLLKLITPPLVTFPIHWAPCLSVDVTARPAERVLPEPSTPAVPAPEPAGAAVEEEPGTPAVPEAPPDAPAAVAVPVAPPASDMPAPAAAAVEDVKPQTPSVAWTQLLVVVWGAGSAGWFALAALRAYRFGRLLRFARPAPDWLREQAEELADRLGLGPCPEVWLLPGRLSPMLWAAGSLPRLLLPEGLLHRLSAEQRATLLAHELAHLRRRDHWVRALEVVVTGLYWWHPVVWLARRGLREAEEQCCDAWVLWALPGSARSYALALVETVDFLSEARAVLPQGASGIGHVHDLRRRITMIMRGATPRRLSWAGGLAVLTLAAALLPLLPTWAQTPAGDRATDTKAADPARKADDDKLRADELQRARAEVQKAEVQIKQMQADLEQAKARLEQAAAQFKAAKARADGLEKGSEEIVIEIRTADGNVKKIKLPSGSKLIGVQDGEGAPVEWKFIKVQPEDRPSAAAVEKDGKRIRVIWAADGPAGGNTEERLAGLEKKVKELTQQVDDLRRQLKQKPTSSVAPTAPEPPPAVNTPARELAPTAPAGAPVTAPPAPEAPPAPRRK
jgi:beta-lactamase regulating signal transducer with metallopeptidase domain